MKGVAREARLARRPVVPVAVLIAEADQEMLEESSDWEEQERRDAEEAAQWADNSDNYGDFDDVRDEDWDLYGDAIEDDDVLLSDLDQYDDEEFDPDMFGEPIDYGEEWEFEQSRDVEDYRDESTPGAEAEPDPEFFLVDFTRPFVDSPVTQGREGDFFLLDPIGTGDPELERIVHGGLQFEALFSLAEDAEQGIQMISEADLYPLESFGPYMREMMRQYQAEQEAIRFLNLLMELCLLLQLLEGMEERTFWQPVVMGFEYEVNERTGIYTGWYRFTHERLADGRFQELNAHTGEVRYCR
jgi:hypothetical protein